MAKKVRISLANKCQLLFGAAVIFILTAALSVVWIRMNVLVAEAQEETARTFANTWLSEMIDLPDAILATDPTFQQTDLEQGLRLSLLGKEEFAFAGSDNPFLSQSIAYFQTHIDANEYTDPIDVWRGRRYYRYARAVRKSDLSRLAGGTAAGFFPTVDVPMITDPLEMVLLLEIESEQARQQLMLNRIYIVAAGLLAGLLAIGVFWFITRRLILSPIRVLRDTAEKISEGDTNIRSDINTGDEFEQLSDMFNTMLENINSNQDQLRSINKSLDLKLGELAETNVSLYEANKIKDEFLANVSHELRTPLNSIIGFAEILQETLKDRTGPIDEKRKRYASNIITSSRLLLELINDLLDLAKIEAGRIELRVGPMSVSDVLEGLINLIRPQADKKQIEIKLDCPRKLPIVQTDASKFQQIIFNFLSNAVKFTPESGRITVAAKLVGGEVEGAKRLRVSVSDTGPGIAKEDRDRIFEKFTQLDATHTRGHGGTGLGLTISRELSVLLQGTIDMESEESCGATFSLLIPLTLESRSVPLMPELTDLRPGFTIDA